MLIDEEAVERLENAGIEHIEIRSVLTLSWRLGYVLCATVAISQQGPLLK